MLIEIKKALNKTLNLPRYAKTFIAISMDFAFVLFLFGLLIIYVLRFGLFVRNSIESLFIALVISLPIFYLFGLYKSIYRHSGPYALLKVFRAIFVYSIFYLSSISFIGIRGIPRTIGLMAIILLISMCS